MKLTVLILVSAMIFLAMALRITKDSGNNNYFDSINQPEPLGLYSPTVNDDVTFKQMIKDAFKW